MIMNEADGLDNVHYSGHGLGADYPASPCKELLL